MHIPGDRPPSSTESFWPISVRLLAPFLVVLCASPVRAELPPERLAAWAEYVSLTEERIAVELAENDRFMTAGFRTPDERREFLRALRSGEVVVNPMTTLRADQNKVEVPGAMIQHWRGAVFIPGVTLDEVLGDVMEPDAAEASQEDVLEARVLDRGDDWLDVYLRLQRSNIVTVTYNTEHHVEYVRQDLHHASSRTVATYIRELEDAGTLRERERPEGEDRGFLWRLNSYWRYEEVEDGVFVECESLTLSRSIPFFVAFIVRPIVARVARESLDRTLTSLRERMGGDS